MESVMTEMEMQITGDFVAWSLLHPDLKDRRDLSQKDLLDAFWKEKLGVEDLEKTVYNALEIVY
jgi:hypothetical protein